MNKKLKTYYEACFDLAEEFNKKYFEDEAGMNAIGGELDGVWEVNDFFFDIQNMAQALEYEFTQDELFDWYYQWTDSDESKLRLNMKTYTNLVRSKL